jgi:A/G-specific adenine glycosylase
MELGATVCLPEDPSCGACPVAGACAALAAGRQSELPRPAARRAPVAVRWTCLWIERGGKVLLWKRGPEERLLKGLWGLPEAGRVPAEPGRVLARTAHSITHHALTVELREGAPREGAVPPPQAAWTPRARVKDRLVSSLWRKLLAPAGYL